jgi:CubicO group peptidase (beta-lactamase class C family)
MLDWIRRRRTASRLTRLVDAHAALGTFAGTVLVAHRGRVLIRTARGLAEREARAPNEPETPFRIGSIGKTFTALAVIRLIEEKTLAPSDSIARFVPELPGAEPILVHHLLSNTSGLPDYLTLPALQPRLAERHALTAVLDYVRPLPPLFEPGARLAYSNTNWILLALALERVTGLSFARALDRLVLQPLGLGDTFVDLDHERAGLAAGYSLEPDGPVPATPIHMSLELGAGGIRSTVDDLLRMDQAITRPGFLRADSLERMKTRVATDGAVGYGYGLFSTTRFGRGIVGHTGGTFGFTAFWSRYPEEDLVTIVLANLDNGSAERLERDLGAVVLGQPYQLPGERNFIEVEPQALAPYTGRYRSSFAGRRIDFAVTLEQDQLFAVFPLLPKARLQALSTTRFFTRLKGGEVIFEFVRDGPTGPFSRIAVDWSGMAMECPRLADR